MMSRYFKRSRDMSLDGFRWQLVLSLIKQLTHTDQTHQTEGDSCTFRWERTLDIRLLVQSASICDTVSPPSCVYSGRLSWLGCCPGLTQPGVLLESTDSLRTLQTQIFLSKPHYVNAFLSRLCCLLYRPETSVFTLVENALHIKTPAYLCAGFEKHLPNVGK